MRSLIATAVALATLSLGLASICAAQFQLGEDALREFRSVRYQNIYTRVPSPGKLVAIKITDSGKTYYVCKEKTGYVIYHVEIRPVEGLKERLNKELKELGKKWDKVHQDELLFSKQRYEEELRNLLHQYCDAVWVRNEVVVGRTPKKRNFRGQPARR